jgi:hypothetical protein
MSLELAKGYSGSMVSIGSVLQLIIAMIIIIIYFCMFFIAVKSKIQIKNGFYIVLGSVILFLSFKHGFVRQDGHMYSFYFTIPFLTGFIYLFSVEDISKKIFLCFTCIMILCLIGISSIFGINHFKGNNLKNTYYRISEFDKNVKNLAEKRNKALEPNVLTPEWNEIIANNTIQILPWELTYAFANNWSGWIPNPVFQLYSVYTKKLDEYSAFSFSEDRIPKYLLLEFKAIDKRNMFLDTPKTWNAIINNYKIVKSDDTRLLLKKINTLNEPILSKFDSKICRFNEVIDIPSSDNHIYVKISIKQSILGKIITTFFRGNPPNIKLKFQDNSEKIYRIIPETLNNPVMIDNLPVNFQHMNNFFQGKISDEFSIKEFILINNASIMFKNKFNIVFFYSQYPVNKVKYNEYNVDEILIPKDIELLKLISNDITYIDFDAYENLILKCGNIDPHLNIPLNYSINKPSGEPIIEIFYTNSNDGLLQIFYDYGSGIVEQYSSERNIPSDLNWSTIRLPVIGWDYEKSLKAIRIDPPNDTNFVIKNIKIISREEKIRFKSIYKIVIPGDISQIPTIDIDSIIINDSILNLKCGTYDPQFVLITNKPLESRYSGELFVKINCSNSKSGILQFFYDYGDGFNEENSFLSDIEIISEMTEVYYPIVNWRDGEQLVSLRIDPPSGSLFQIESIEIVEK